MTPPPFGMTVAQIAESLIRSGDPTRVPQFVACLGPEDSEGQEVFFMVTDADEYPDGAWVFQLEPLR